MSLACFAQEILSPSAARLDHDRTALKDVWDAFVAQGLHRFEGMGLFDVLPLLAQHSGAFAFVALQQLVAGSQDPPAGVAFGHLRNPSGPAPLWYDGLVSGPLPWLTGAGLFERVLLGFRLQDGSEVRAWVFAQDRPEFRHSAPLALIALSGTDTRSVTCTNLEVPKSAFLSVKPPGTEAREATLGVLGQTPLMLGALRASLRLLQESGRGDLALAQAKVATLEAEISRAYSNGTAGTVGPALRARAGELSVRLARLACMACGGVSLVTGHPAERLYREALVYNLMAQTDSIVMDAFKELT